RTCSCIGTAPAIEKVPRGMAMPAKSTINGRWNDPVDVLRLGWSLNVTLVVLYVLCWLAALLAPKLPLPHGWLLFFSPAEPGSGRRLIEGIVGSVVFAWISALLFGLTYNSLKR